MAGRDDVEKRVRTARDQLKNLVEHSVAEAKAEAQRIHGSTPLSFPEGWTTTLSDLRARRDPVPMGPGSREWEWAYAYELSLLPPDTVFPREGDILSVVEGFRVQYVANEGLMSPDTGYGMLMPGDSVEVHRLPLYERSLSAEIRPVNYVEVEERIIPRELRDKHWYQGFHLFVSTVELSANARWTHGRPRRV